MRTAIILLSLSIHAQIINTPRAIETLDLDNDATLASLLADREGNRYFIGNTTAMNFPATPGAFRGSNPSVPLVRSDDAGRTFKRLDDKLPDKLTLFTPASEGRTIYGQSNRGIWISRDAGDSWQIINPSENVSGLAINPLNPRNLLGIRFNEVYESFDEGRSWLPSSSGIPEFRIGIASSRWVNRLAWSKTAPGIQVAITLNGIYARSRAYPSWSLLAEASTSTAIAFAPPGILYFSINGKLNSWPGTRDQTRTIDTPEDCRDIQTHPIQEGWLLCGNRFLSLDSGLTWSPKPPEDTTTRFAANLDGLYSYGNSTSIFRNGERIYIGRSPLNVIAEGRTLFVSASPTTDVYVTKRTPSGQPIFTTLIGGLGGDVIDSATLDPQGNLYLAGRSNSEDFEGAYGFDTPGYFGFVVKLAPNGAWLGGYSYPGDRAFYPAPAPIQLAPNGDVYVINGQDEILRFDSGLTRLQLRASVPQSTINLIESFAIGPDNTVYIAGYDTRPISKVLHFTRDLTPIDTREFEFGFVVKQILFDSQQRLVTGGWFYRRSTECAAPLLLGGVVLDTRFYRDDFTATLTATCDSFLNSFVASPTGELAVRFNNNRLAYVDWVNTPSATVLPLNFARLLWRGTSLEVAGTNPQIRLLRYSPLVN